MSATAERDFALDRGATREHVLHGPVTEERPRAKAKALQPFGLHQKQAGDFVARRSQSLEGYAPSSRLVVGLFLMQRWHSQFFNGLLRDLGRAATGFGQRGSRQLQDQPLEFGAIAATPRFPSPTSGFASPPAAGAGGRTLPAA